MPALPRRAPMDNAEDLLTPGQVAHARDLMLSPREAHPAGYALLKRCGLSDPAAADRVLQSLVGDQHHLRPILADLLPALLRSLMLCADADMALRNFSRLARAHGRAAGFFRQFADNLRLCEDTILLLSGSQFLADLMVRFSDYFALLGEPDALRAPLDANAVEAECRRVCTQFADPSAQLDALRRRQAEWLFRIGACDLLGWWDVPAVTRALSIVAESIVRQVLEIEFAGLSPPSADAPRPLAIIGMGKLGGEELNYSSDIDLIFVARDDAEEAATRIGQRIIRALTRPTGEGYFYRVDMRLRPEGAAGRLAPTLTSYQRYLVERARPWEHQALVKARHLAGNGELTRRLLATAEPLIFREEWDDLSAHIARMKARIESYLRSEGKSRGHLKLGAGGIRDIEFIIQHQQLLHGRRHPELRTSNSLRALTALQELRIVSVADCHRLRQAYCFLRAVEHRLQMMFNLQTHSLPSDIEKLRQLAIRCGYPPHDDQPPERLFGRDHARHTTAVREIFEQTVGSPTAHGST